MGIAEIALDPPTPLPPSAEWANLGKKVPQTILTNSYSVSYTPRQRGKKVPQTILASLYTPLAPPPPPQGQCPWKQHLTKRGFANLNDNV